MMMRKLTKTTFRVLGEMKGPCGLSNKIGVPFQYSVGAFAASSLPLRLGGPMFERSFFPMLFIGGMFNLPRTNCARRCSTPNKQLNGKCVEIGAKFSKSLNSKDMNNWRSYWLQHILFTSIKFRFWRSSNAHIWVEHWSTNRQPVTSKEQSS